MKLTATTLIADAFVLWRADRDMLMRVASAFVLLPALAAALFLQPALAKTIEALPPDDTLAPFRATMAWMTANAPWLLLAQIAANFGALTIVMLYLDRPQPDLRGALRQALRYLPAYVVAMLIVSMVASIGLFALVIGYFYVLARLSLIGPAMVVERERNPLAALARSIALTRGHGFALTGVVIIVLLAGHIAQSPFSILDAWIAVHAPNPIARAIVDVAASGITALTAIAAALVQVAAWRRLAPR